MKRLATSVLVSLATLGAAGQTDAGRPRLVVGIVVDQLRTDYIEYLQSHFGERGFKTLLGEGVYMREVDFKVPNLDAANATAMLMTGAYPGRNGVPQAMVPDLTSVTGATRPTLATGQGGSYALTNDSFTPEALRLTTIADELAVDCGGTSKIYSVAMDPQQAVILAGHAGTGAVWVNNSSGNWATTSWYGALPSPLQSRNLRMPLQQRIDTMAWRPEAQLARVQGLPEKKRASGFRHTFSRSDRDVFKKYAASALSNTEVTDVAIDLIDNFNLGGSPGEVDMLNVAYTLAPFRYAGDGTGRTELTDSYLKLDRQLARLIDAIDRKVGRGNTIIWLTSTGYFDDAMATEPRYRLPGGEFSSRKARSLLNSYLSAKFGQGEYVTSIRDGHVYFDKRTLESGRIDPDRVVEDAKSFLSKMSGVDEVLTLNEILTPANYETEAWRLAIDPRNSGEMIIRFTPGWDVVYDEQTPPVTKQSRETAMAAPAFILAPGLAPRKIDEPVDAVRIAPTVAGALRIRAPNGAKSRKLF